MSQYRKSDQRKPMIRCPHCGEKQILDWGTEDSPHGVKWEKTDEGKHIPESAMYYCRSCGAGINDGQRLRALKSVRWYQTKGFHCCGERQDPLNNDTWEWDDWAQCHYALCRHCNKRGLSNRHAGFWASNLYSPFRTLGDMARSFLESLDSPTKLQTFVNTELAQIFEDAAEEIDPESLQSRKEAMPYQVPDNAHVIIATVDTQDDRLECLRVAANLFTEELWVIDQSVFPGDTGQSEPWDMLDAFLQERLYRSDGRAFLPVVTGIDIQGHRRDIAQRFVQQRVGRGFYALSGKAERNGGRSDIWPGNPSRRNKLKLPIYQISVNAAKDLLASRLAIRERERQGYIHFNADLKDEFFDQLTAERAVPKNIGGRWVNIWELKADKKRNEAFDLMVYAFAMLRCIDAMPKTYKNRMLPPPVSDKAVPIPRESKPVRPPEAVSIDSFKNKNTDKSEQSAPPKITHGRRRNSLIKPKRKRGIRMYKL